MGKPDDQLVRAYLNGDEDAFNALYARYKHDVLRFLVSLGGTHEQAEDAFQNTWIKVVRHLGSYRGRNRFRGWLFTTAYRTWLSEVRSSWERRKVCVGGQETDFEGLPIDPALARVASHEKAIIARERREMLYTALDALPDVLRQTVLLRTDGGLSFKEVARVMECPLGTALWRMNEAVKRLKTLLGE
jgi:RNA polymerase sigma-70 factor (ECF subfamily)